MNFTATNSDPTTPAVPFDWKMAQEEVMRADLSNDPIQAAIARLERQVSLEILEYKIIPQYLSVLFIKLSK